MFALTNYLASSPTRLYATIAVCVLFAAAVEGGAL